MSTWSFGPAFDTCDYGDMVVKGDYVFDPTSPGPIGATTPAQGTFTWVVCDKLQLADNLTWTGGVGAPSATCVIGSVYSRTDGGVGSTLYVSRGGGVWNAVPGV